MKWIRVLLFAALASPAAHAQEWYAAFGAGQANIDGYQLPVETSTATATANVTSFSFSPLTGRDTLLSARLGARLHRYVALEAGYYRMGNHTFRTATPGGPAGSSLVIDVDARVRSAGAALVGIVPLGVLDLYARGGYARTEIKADAAQAGSVVSARQRFNEGYYGAGARWNMTRQASLFAEYQRHAKLELDGWIAGLEWRF